MRDKIRRDAFGIPHLTVSQTKRAHLYAVDLARTGTTRRTCSPELLACAMADLAVHTRRVHAQLQQFLTGVAQAAPARDVAKLAIELVTHLQSLPPHDQVAYLTMLLGDDDSLISNDTDTTTTH